MLGAEFAVLPPEDELTRHGRHQGVVARAEQRAPFGDNKCQKRRRSRRLLREAEALVASISLDANPALFIRSKNFNSGRSHGQDLEEQESIAIQPYFGGTAGARP